MSVGPSAADIDQGNGLVSFVPKPEVVVIRSRRVTPLIQEAKQLQRLD
jgi:hypothetical protein